MGDYVAGTNAALAVAAALADKENGGRRVDVSLRGGLMAIQSGWNAIGFATRAQPERTGTASPFLAPNRVFSASDGPFTLAIVSDRHFELLADALERPDLIRDYPTNEDRMKNRASLERKLSRLFRGAAVDHWVDLLGGAGLPAGRVLTIAEAFDDPQARHDEMLVEMDHPVAGRVKTTGSPIKIDGSSARASAVPATLGQHTRSILGELGADEETTNKMIEQGTAVAS